MQYKFLDCKPSSLFARLGLCDHHNVTLNLADQVHRAYAICMDAVKLKGLGVCLFESLSVWLMICRSPCLLQSSMASDQVLDIYYHISHFHIYMSRGITKIRLPI